MSDSAGAQQHRRTHKRQRESSPSQPTTGTTGTTNGSNGSGNGSDSGSSKRIYHRAHNPSTALHSAHAIKPARTTKHVARTTTNMDMDSAPPNGGGGTSSAPPEDPPTTTTSSSSTSDAAPVAAPAVAAPTVSAPPVIATAAAPVTHPPPALPPQQQSLDVATSQIAMRTLIVTQDASIIIGRAGKNVNEIREKSGARVTITESLPGNPERVMTVSGQLDAVSKAFGLIVRRINDEPFDTPSLPGSRTVTIRFIVPNARMGSVIGKGGSKIKEIQEASGAKLQASDTMLPGSTERVLSIAGVADAVHIAVYYVGTVLLEHAPVATMATSAYRPGAAAGTPQNPAAGPYGAGPGSFIPPSAAQRAAYAQPTFNPAAAFAGVPPASVSAPPGAPPQHHQPPQQQQQPGQSTQQMFVPNEFVGSIIGKGGAKINEVRMASGCFIKICEPGEAFPGASGNERVRPVACTRWLCLLADVYSSSSPSPDSPPTSRSPSACSPSASRPKSKRCPTPLTAFGAQPTSAADQCLFRAQQLSQSI